MKSAWKWILGILLSLVVIGLAVVPFLFRMGMRFMPAVHGFGGRSFRGFDMPGPYGMFGGLMGGVMVLRMVLLPILVIALLILIGYWIGSARRKATLTAEAVQPAAQTPPVPVQAKACAQCGKTLQADWANCPYCGVKAD